MHSKRLRAYTVIFLIFFAELILFDKLRLHGIRPEALLIATVFFGFHFGIARGMEMGAVSGMLKGALSMAGSGLNLFSFIIIGFLSGYLKDKLFKENFLTQALFSFFSVYILWGIVFAHGQLSLTEMGIGLSPFGTTVLYKGLYTAVLAPFLFLALTGTLEPKDTPGAR